MASPKKLMAGERIESRCRRCNDITGHIIVAMVGGEIFKVECQACRSVHRYHPPQGAAGTKEPAPRTRRAATPGQPRPAAAAATARAGSSRQAQATENAWRDAVNLHVGEAKPYSMNSSFERGDLVAHPTFGQGIVQSVEAPNKMDVLFQDGVRSLRCAL